MARNQNAIPMTGRSVEDLASRLGISAEHVLLESQELDAPGEGPRTVRAQSVFRNRVRKVQIALTFFNGGYLGYRETRAGRTRPEYSMDLRFLDPRPLVKRRFAERTAKLALSLLAVTAASGVLAYFGFMPDIMLVAAASGVIGTCVAVWVFVKKTEELVAFRTRHGRAIVLTIVANLGCLRSCRKISRKLTRAIEKAHEHDPPDKERLVRAEIREIYRLSDAGLISADARTAAIRKALSHF